MSKVKIQGNASGTGVLTVTAPNTSTDRTITLPDGDVTLGAATPSIDDNGNATAITIDSSERVGIGTSSPATELHTENASQSVANRVAYNGTYYTDYGYYRINTQQNDFAIRTTDVTRLTVKNDFGDVNINTGDLIFGTAGKGVVLGSTTNNDANTLDDYEEGTYTPVFNDTSNATMTGTLESCLYTKVGRLVHVMVYYSISNAQNGNLSTMTLPFNQTGSGRGAGSITTYACPNANKGNEIYLNGGSKVAFWQVRDNATSIPMAVDNGSELILSITYMAA